MTPAQAGAIPPARWRREPAPTRGLARDSRRGQIVTRIFHASLALALLLVAGCGDDHRHDDPQGHAHGAGDEGNTAVVTHFTDRTELFVEFPFLAVGEESPFAAHFTRLSDFRPVDRGTVTVRLVGRDVPEERFEAGPASIPGIFRPVATPARAGERRLIVELTTPEFSTVHDLGVFPVFANRAAANAAPAPEERPGLVAFLKEQQWKLDFATAPAEARVLHHTVPATGIVRGRADGDVRVSATTAGHVLPAGGGFPRLGQKVSAGETVARIMPRLGSGVDVAALRTELARAESEVRLTEEQRRRTEDMVRRGLVHEVRLTEMRGRESVARADLNAAQARLASAGSPAAASASGVALTSPIGGIVVEVSSSSGAFVDEGAPLVRVVDLERLWLEARVTEADSLRIVAPDGVWFDVAGRPAPVSLHGPGARLVAAGGAVDPVTRTVPVIFEFKNPGDLKVGMHVAARVRTGARAEGVAVPVSALVDEGGQDVLFVLADGEHFERRIVRLGIREGDMVHVAEGLQVGERVVVRGAYLVRLAATGPAAAGHGHAH